MWNPSRLRVLLTPQVLLGLLSVWQLLPATCYAEKQVQVTVDQQVATGTLSPPLFGIIHGSGNVDVAKLHYDFQNSNDDEEGEGVVTAVNIFLPKASDRTKFTKWLEADTASSRARRDEFLASQGIGATGRDGTYYVCCTRKALAAGACDLDWTNNAWWDKNQKGPFNLSLTGNMILSPPNVRFRTLDINRTVTDLGMHGILWFGETRHVALFFANCDSTSTTTSTNTTTTTSNTQDDTVHIYGTVTWTSFISARTLPLYIILSLCHAGLCLWYRELMNKNRESRIEVEEWIFFTLFLATFATILKTIYFLIETISDDEWLNLSFAAALSRSITHAVSRCLYLFLAMGVGVTAPQLECIKTSIVIALFLGIWIICAFIMDLTYYDIENPILLNVAGFTSLGLDLIFMIWIPIAICKTMKLLTFRNESLKLERYSWIWKIYCLAIFLGILRVIFWIIDFNINAGRDYDFMTQDEQQDIIYLIIIACMASLWKPNPSQQIYSYQLLGDDGESGTPDEMSLELSGVKNFGENDEHDLQLSPTSSF